MGKYLNIVSNSIKKNLAYRANSFIMMISVFISFGVLFYFWSSIYRQGNQIGSYSLNEIISYYVFISVFELLFAAGTAWSVGDEIKNGKIISVVLKPLDHLWYKFSQALGDILYRFIIFTGFIVLLFYLFRSFLTISYDENILFFILLALLSFALKFLVYYIAGILCFWIDDHYGFLFAWFVIVSFMQGQWLPLDLLPSWFVVIGDYLPFKYLFFVPISVVSGRMEFEYYMLAVPLLWSAGLFLLAKILFFRGIKKYEGFGV